MPLRSSLVTTVEDGILKVANFAERRLGVNGRVRIVNFKEDPIPNRSFAIKRPKIQDEDVLNCYINYQQFDTYLNVYVNNYDVSLRLKDFSYFMKVHGIVIKIHKNRSHKFNKKVVVPYLILSSIKGEVLQDVIWNCSLNKKIFYYFQVIEALLELYECRIKPIDLSTHNMMITNEDRLKLIDYDFWIVEDLKNVDLVKLCCQLFKVGFSTVLSFLENNEYTMDYSINYDVAKRC